ncbi:MAG: hypothetical protein O2890_14245 [Cyanobacteria bacterium]|nr:hypothetical protein [Cyanobacteriota bacterium]MDA0867537.1 hypothetical protein [Cyanobacteriota bacterium]
MALPIQTYTLVDEGAASAHGIKVGYPSDVRDLGHCLDAFGLSGTQATLVVIGGASGLNADQKANVESLFRDVLFPLAEELQLCVVDGGTDAGVMQLMGQARAALAGTFPLIGVAPRSLVQLPDDPHPNPDGAPLEPNHTHCLLVPGTDWGDESEALAQVAALRAGAHPSLTVLVNGGSVTWQEAQISVEDGRAVVVMAGSGRAADAIAAALQGQPSDDARLEPLLSSGLLSYLSLTEDPLTLRQALTAQLFKDTNCHEQTQGLLQRHP